MTSFGVKIMGIYSFISVIAALVLDTNIKKEWIHDDGLSEITNWLETDPAIIHHMELTREMMERTRNELSAVPRNVLSDKPLHTSPSFQLMGSDASDKRFLEKDTIKHSVSDLSTQSLAKVEPKKTELSCGAVQVGYSIYFTHCYGELTVITFVGTQRMACREIEQRIFFGPVVLKSERCIQTFVFDRDWYAKRNAGYSSSSCPKTSATLLHMLQLVPSFIIITILLIVIQVLLKLRKGLQTTNGSTQLIKKGGSFYATYYEWYEGNGEKKTGPINDESKMNIVEKQYRISLIKLVILTLLFRPLSVHSYEIVSSFNPTLMTHSYVLDLVDQETIKLGQEIISMNPVVHTAQLVKMFDTASWNINHKEEYFCQWYKCEAYSVCGVTALPFIKAGELADSLFKYSNVYNGYYTCQKLRDYCTFGMGCKLISIEIIPDDNELYTIYSISKGGSHGGEVSVPPGCYLETAEDKSSGELRNYYLVSDNKRTHYLCSEEMFSMKPEDGMLGDIQIGEKGTIAFMTNEIVCTADNGDHALCRYPSPFINQIGKYCHTPKELGMKLSINTQERYLTWLLSGTVRINIKCDRPLPLVDTKIKCHNLIIKVWEISHLDAPLIISFSAESGNGEGNFKFPSSVHLRTNLFKCDGVLYFSELYDLRSLNSSGLSFSHEIIPYEEIDNLQHDHFSNSDPDDSRFISPGLTIQSWLPTILTTPVIIILLILTMSLLCRK